MLWLKAKSVSTRPSEMLGLHPRSYEAYCLDEAVIYFGVSLDSMLQNEGQKPSKDERRAKAAREALLAKVFGQEKAGTGFADPALMFK